MTPDRRARSRLRALLKPVVNLLFFGVALWAVDRVLQQYRWREVVDALGAVPLWSVVLGFAVGLGAHLALVLYDYIAFRVFQHPLPLHRVLIPSFIAATVNNSAPAPLVTATGVRVRLYQKDVPLGIAAQVAAFNIGTHMLGLAALTGALLLAGAAGRTVPVVGLSSRVLGIALVLGTVAYLAYALSGASREIRVWRLTIRLPSRRLALAQLGVSVAGWLLAGTALYVLLRAPVPVPWFPFITSFLIARAVMLVVAVPGGIGVLEALMLLLRPADTPAPNLLVALFLYRVLYYLLPLMMAGVLFAVREMSQSGANRPLLQRITEWAQSLAPRLLGVATFLAGLLLLVTGAIPYTERRFEWLSHILPPVVVQMSEFLASVVGAVLVLLAWALEARIRLAYELVRILVIAGIVLTLVRSFHALDIGLAVLLAIYLAILLLAERRFPSEGALLRRPMHHWWIFAIGVVFLLDLWVGVVVLRQAEIAGETWWRVVLSPEIPGALRVAVGAAVVMLLFAVGRLLVQDEPGKSREE